jgi:hypothetical protein
MSDKATKAKDASKANRLREKWKKGKELSEGDHGWLIEYESRDGTATDYTDAMRDAQPPTGGPPADESVGDSGGGLPSLEFAKPPPPPKDEPKAKAKSKSKAKGKTKDGKRERRDPSDWRSKYKGSEMDRETVCVQLASAYCGFLSEVGKRSKAIGGLALPPEAIEKVVFPAAIACMDDWLPDTKAAPELVVAGSGAFQLGAFLVAKRKQGQPIDVEGEYVAEEPEPESEPEPKSDDEYWSAEPDAGVVQ